MTWRNRVEVSYAALRSNFQAVKKASQGRHVIAVVKANAYGLGLERCATIYHQAGAAALAVVSVAEADRIRRVLPDARVLLLGSPLPGERSAAIASAYETSCSSLSEAEALASLADAESPHRVHVDMDSGMGRFGAKPDEVERIVRFIMERESLRLVGISSHYPMASDSAIALKQEQLIESLLGRLPPLPVDCWIHYANSEGLLMRPKGSSHAVRVGLLLTGVVPDGCPDIGIAPAVRWISSLNLVKRMAKGDTVSYNCTHSLSRDSVVGIIPVGYADGVPIALSNRGMVLVNGRRCPILGRVTMDYIAVDLTDLDKAPVVGAEVVLLGRQGQGKEGEITVNEFAAWSQTIPYDILCGLRGRSEVVGV
jgi:alanine racemase